MVKLQLIKKRNKFDLSKTWLVYIEKDDPNVCNECGEKIKEGDWILLHRFYDQEEGTFRFSKKIYHKIGCSDESIPGIVCKVVKIEGDEKNDN